MRRLSFIKNALLGVTTLGTETAGLPVPVRRDGESVGAYGSPSHFERSVVRRPSGLLSPALTPLGEQCGAITPSGLCFTRNHAGVPNVDPREHRLLVHGRVKRPLIFSLADLMRFPLTVQTNFLECAGNSASGWERLGATVQFSHGLASNCVWSGVALRHILDEAGPSDGATWVLAEGADGDLYERSIPLSAALGDALVAFGQNGEMLRPEQGYPLRLVLPGLEGSANVKWLRRLHVTNAPAYGRNETATYARPMPDGTRRVFDLVMDVKSVITWPSAGMALHERGPYELRGFAWSGRGRIVGVDATLDGGTSWQTATLLEPILSKSFTQFTMPFRFEGAPLRIASRARDESGAVQPTRAQFLAQRGTDAAYHVNPIATWSVAADGSLTNGDAP